MPIKIQNLNFTYNKDMSYQQHVLKDVNLELEDGFCYGIIGKTGSGKSTLIQHLNALLLPQSGEININEYKLVSNAKNKKLKSLRKDVGLVFQFNEYQLFEETVLKDVSFGPKNFGLSEEEAIEKAKKSLELMGLEEKYYQVSPFDLSGGQKRKAAIAGILAIDPKIIVLDEPTVGLDPQSAKEMIALLRKLNKDFKKTIIIVTHDYEVLYSLVDEVILIDDGQVIAKKKTKELFLDEELIKKYELEKPNVLKFLEKLKDKGFKMKEYYYDLSSLIKDLVGEMNE